jgi:two-component system cell cycle response regulator
MARSTRSGKRAPRSHTLALLLERHGRPLLRLAPAAATLCMAVLLSQGRFASLDGLGPAETGAMLLLLAGLGAVGLRRMRIVYRGSARLLRDDLELGSVVLAASYAVVRVGGPQLYPLIYLVMAFLVAFLPRSAGALLLAEALLFDAAVQLLAVPPHAMEFASHAAFLSLFGGLYHAVLAAQLASARVAEASAVKRRLAEVEERARAYRLVNAGGADSVHDVDEREKWMLASVKEVEGAVSSALEIAEIALSTHTCAVFLLSVDERELKLHDCRSQSEQVRRDSLQAGEGLLASAIKRRAPIRLCGNLKGVNYYEGSAAVQSVLAVPLLEASSDGTGPRVRGVLVADRRGALPFSDDDERLLTAISGEVLRAIEVERVMGYIKKTRDEKDRFYKAIEELNRVSKPSEVFATALELARSLCRLDFVAFTVAEEHEGKRRHRVTSVSGVTAAHALQGHTFPDNNGLVANVVRYGAPLPGRDVRSMDAAMIFDDEAAVKGLAGLKIFPLRAGDKILGTLVAGSRKRGVLDDEAMRVLEVLAIQAAQSVLRAQLFEQMEKMATTDGLTGLTNHKTFQSRFDEQLSLARRYGRNVSFVLTDIDHFKSVNDTYGHPIGDQVLKGVAKILQETARDTDIVARYGGEEFALVMPETDLAGAKVIAERIRERVQATIFPTELGPLRVTMSLGVSNCPTVSDKKEVLIDKADQCLYFAKHHGRNKSITVPEMDAGNRVRVVEAG